MMREIKFRAWIAKDGVILFSGYLLAEFFTWLERWEESKGPYIVTQYTGLKDKSGIEIYEGDVIQWGENIESVYYCEKDAYFQTRTSMLDSIMEVIGNIYENPELIKEGKE